MPALLSTHPPTRLAPCLPLPLPLSPPRYFLRKLRKVKKANGQIVAINEIFERNPTTVKNYGIWVSGRVGDGEWVGGGMQWEGLLGGVGLQQLFDSLAEGRGVASSSAGGV